MADRRGSLEDMEKLIQEIRYDRMDKGNVEGILHIL